MDKSSLVDKLNDKNYATWKIQQKMALINNDLWGIVDGSETAPTDPNALTKFNNRKAKALATIVLGIESKLLYLLGDPSDPVQVWQSLQDISQKKSWSNKFRLKKQLYGMKLKATDNLQDHLKKMMEIFDELAVIGEPQKDEDRVICLLSSLPDKFSTLVTALEASATVPSWETVVDRLMHEESKISNADKNDTALMSNSNQSSGHYNKFKNQIKCFECGKSGHIRKNCFRLKNKDKGNFIPRNKANTAADQDEDMAIFARNYAAVEKNRVDKNLWIFDSGCTQHVCNDKSMFINMSEVSTPASMEVGDGTPLSVRGKGDVILQVVMPNKCSQKLTLRNVLFVPDMNHNLISVSQCTSKNKKVLFYENSCKILSNKNKLVACGSRIGKLYYIDCMSLSSASIAKSQPAHLWHRRLGHVCNSSLQKMINQKLVKGLENVSSDNNDVCDDCAAGKIHRTPFPTHDYSQPRKKFELIHSDVCGRLTPETVGGASYIVTFIDDATRFCWVYALKTKDEVFSIFKEWKTMVENQFDVKVKSLKTDNGGEYCSNTFENYLKAHGIIHLKTIPKTPEQNGMAECKNRHLIETVRSMISDANVGKELWGEAVLTANYIINRCYTRALTKMTPYEALYGRKPSVSHVRVFGSRVHAHVPKDERSKLDPKSRTAILVGYGSNVKGYRLYDPSKRKVFYSRDIIFDENYPKSIQKELPVNTIMQNDQVKSVTIDIDESLEEPVCMVEDLPVETAQHESDGSDSDLEFHDTMNRSVSNPELSRTMPSPIPEPRISKYGRTIKSPERYGDWCSIAVSSPEPTSVQDAVCGPEADNWLAAMNEEMKMFGN